MTQIVAVHVVQSKFSNFVAFPREDDVVAQSKIGSVFEFIIFKFTTALVAFLELISNRSIDLVSETETWQP